LHTDNPRIRPTDPGCITSTPKSVNFSKKSEKWPKNERGFCMPGPKNGERPYLAVPGPTFWGSFFAPFCPTFCSSHPSNRYTQLILFLFIVFQSNNQVRDTPPSFYSPHFNYNTQTKEKQKESIIVADEWVVGLNVSRTDNQLLNNRSAPTLGPNQQAQPNPADISFRLHQATPAVTQNTSRPTPPPDIQLPPSQTCSTTPRIPSSLAGARGLYYINP